MWVGNHFEIGLLWKKKPPILVNSFDMAKNRLLVIKKRGSSDALFAEK